MNDQCHDTLKLTRNQALVLGVLSQSEAPQSAYSILDKLKGDGLRAPAQVYRALDTLIATKQVHRIESLNAYVACDHSHSHKAENIAFAICDSCGHVTEFSGDALTKSIAKAARSDGFTVQASAIELRGVCGDCSTG